MADIPDIDTALYNKLTNDAGVSALVSSRVYGIHAPSGSAYPLVTFMLMNAGIPNDTPRQSVDWTYRVHSWDTNGSDAEALHEAVYAALHRQQLTISGWTNYVMNCTGGVKLVETEAGQSFYHFVWDVRVRASED